MVSPPVPSVLAEAAPALSLPTCVPVAEDEHRGRARRALSAAAVDGSLHTLVADARNASHDRRCGRRGKRTSLSASFSSVRPGWHFWLVALGSTLLISVWVLVVGGAAYSLGRCMTLPWAEDKDRHCVTAIGLGSALLATCVWSTFDRHYRFSCRPRGTARTRISASGVGEVDRDGYEFPAGSSIVSRAPKPAELLVEYTTARLLSQQPRTVQEVLQQQVDRDKDRDRDSCGSFETVTVGELATMVTIGALPSHSRVRAAPHDQCSTSSRAQRSSESRLWVLMDSFIDMSMSLEPRLGDEQVTHDRHADLVERL